MAKAIIVVDGPAGAGKSTAIEAVASYFHGLDQPVLAISSGIVYRAITYIATCNFGCSESAMKTLSGKAFVRNAAMLWLEIRGNKVYARNGEIAERLYRNNEIGSLTPIAAGHPEVREYANRLLQYAVQQHDGLVVLDGRDMAEVFPDSLKLYLHVSDEVAAQRMGVTVEAVRERNQADREHAVGALKTHPDAVVIDTSNLNPEEVVIAILDVITMQFPELARPAPIQPA